MPCGSVGDDRVKEFSNITSKYNGKTYNFGKLDVISAGARDDKSDDIEGMSASKMRQAASDNDYDAFKKGLPKDLKSKEAKSIYMQLRKSMNLEEQLWQIAPKLDYNSLREEYFQENIFNVGDVVESLTTGIEGEIIVRGPNYIIMIDEEGRTFRQWLDSITEKVHYEVGTDDYRIALQQLTPGEKVQSFTGKSVPEPGTPPVTQSVKKKTTK